MKVWVTMLLLVPPSFTVTVMVDEPSIEDTISILRGLKERYEVHHGIRIKDSALVTAAMLSKRYITDRFMPDKAIDLMDEAAARLRTEKESMPTNPLGPPVTLDHSRAKVSAIIRRPRLAIDR